MASETARSWASSKLAWSIMATLVAVAISAALDEAGVLEDFENATWAWRVRACAKPSPSTARIKVITVDQGSFDWAFKENDLRWPWPREVYGPIVDFCTRSGTRCVAFDVLCSEPSNLAGDDERLGASVAANGRFIAGFFTGNQAEQERTWPQAIRRPPIFISDKNGLVVATNYPALREWRAAFPVLPVATNAACVATVREVPDNDHQFRRVTAFRVFDETFVPSLGLAAYVVGEGQTRRRPSTPRGVKINGSALPLDSSGRVILRFRGKSGTHRNLTASSVIQSELRLREGKIPTVSTNELRDAFVFVGYSAPGLKDIRATPVDPGYPATELHATFLDNFLEGDFLRAMPILPVLLVTLVIAFTASLQVLHGGGLRGMLGGAAIFSLMPILTGFAGYTNGYWWPVAWPALAVTLSIAGSLFWNLSSEGQQRRFLKSAFRQYLSHEVVEILVADPSALRLGGEKRELTMFFSDLEKFSSFSEKLDPPTLTQLLNDFLTGATRIIKDDGGTLDKFVGDAIVAFWNAPIPQADHALRACRAAVQVQRWLEIHRAELEQRARAPFRLRIGLHTGDVTVGNMGSADRFNYTVLGDAANLASRLEGANKFFGTFTMASESTWRMAADGLIGRELGKLQVVGRKEPVCVYEVVGVTGEPEPPQLKDFRRGLDLCRENKFEEALNCFAANPSDPASSLYAKKCRELIASGEKFWDMTWSMTEK